jgi:hypothetical protein
MKTIICLITFLTMLTVHAGHRFLRTIGCRKPSENRANLDSIKINRQIVSIIFWNVENLYDPFDDTLKLDNEFTSEGEKHWTWTRFRQKINLTAKTLLSAGGWEFPVIIGLCEVENKFVLNRLVSDSPMQRAGYRIIHYDSPDNRGVDVALLYRPEGFTPLMSRPVEIRYPFDTLARTRDILMVKGVLKNMDTLVILINHWPSRRGGQAYSAPRRNFVASTLRKVTDSLFRENPITNIVITGDFNDDPFDVSLQEYVGAKTEKDSAVYNSLYNLSGIRNGRVPEGTLKFRDQWNTFDQFIVSGALYHGKAGLKASEDASSVFRPSFLVEEDKTYFGTKLKRTYAGPRYLGGFSDHLPVVLKISLVK